MKVGDIVYHKLDDRKIFLTFECPGTITEIYDFWGTFVNSAGEYKVGKFMMSELYVPEEDKKE